MAFQFDGFSAPNGTYVPDEVFDILAPELSEAELRVLLYIIRRTFGFKKKADDISLKQMTDGITKRDGTVLDRGTGMSKSANWRGVKGLLEKGIIISQRNSSSEKGDLPTSYSLRFKTTLSVPGNSTSGSPSSGSGGETTPKPQSEFETSVVPVPNAPVFSKRTPPGSSEEHPRVLQENTQETVKQQTGYNLSNIRKQNAAENQTSIHQASNRQPIISGTAAPTVGSFEALGATLSRVHTPVGLPAVSTEEARDAIRAYLKDIAIRFNDQAPLESSVSRACNLYSGAHLPLSEFLGRLLEVSSSMRELRSKVKKQAKGGKATMPYFFACLEDRLGLRHQGRGEHRNEPHAPAQEVAQESAQLSPRRTSSPRGEQGGNSPLPHTHSFTRPVAQAGRAQSGQSSVDARSASAAAP
jgi:hypothetical protein